MKLKITLSALFVVTALFASSATARNTKVELSVKKAATEGEMHENLLDVPYFMKGQKHPKVKKSLITVKSNQKGRAFGRSDDEACQVAFINSLLSLQKRAQNEDADAIINIISVTRNSKFESSTKFQCVVGTFVSHVALKGELVKFAK
ncbi:hypothetical protein MNBD_NITROSPINAE02-2078 [hydrothermal vent metagenome]|uniref:Excinuclease ATPase subunit n=1 Tax=hydrothermal vent metagenome TaxID=652676 RepID=A0A3B1BZX7_9ZZZZ